MGIILALAVHLSPGVAPSAANPPIKVLVCGAPVALVQGSGTVKRCEWVTR